MKPFNLFFILILAAVKTSTAQVVIEDNPSYINAADKPYLDKILDATVLAGTTEKEDITPTGQKICFDKKIKVKTNTLTGPAEICLFINTKIGLVAYSSLKAGATGNCDIKQDQPDFSLSIISLKGNLYTYQNIKKKNTVEHWMTTGNSNRFMYQYSSTASNSMLYKKEESKTYCGGKIKAWAYKYEDRNEKWFLFGKSLPSAVVMQPLKYLGNFGVGFQYTDKGLLLIMEVNSDVFTSEIKSIEDVYICFDPAPFKVLEDERLNRSLTDITKKRERLRSRITKIKTDDCESSELQVINYEIEALNRQEENVRQAAIGNLQQSYATQHAATNSMINYDDVIQGSIYDTQLKICRTTQQLNKASGNNRDSYQQRLSCLNDQLRSQIRTQQQFNQVNTQYPRDTGKRFAEKSKLYMQNLKGCN